MHERTTNLSLLDHCGTFAIEFEDITVLDQNDVVFRVTEMVFHKLSVSKEHAILTMNRNDIPGTHRFGQDANVFLRRMTTYVNKSTLLLDDVCTALVDETNHARNQSFIAWNDARR